jgi:hypothetical protein
MRAMTAHEKECALAAIALRIERAEKERNRLEAKEWRAFRREVIAAPIDPE